VWARAVKYKKKWIHSNGSNKTIFFFGTLSSAIADGVGGVLLGVFLEGHKTNKKVKINPS
jgi:hypothetical protein